MSPEPTDHVIRKGMEKQLKLRQARVDAGERAVGWKVGFGSAAAMSSLGIDRPLIGFLTDGSLLRSQATVNIAAWFRALLEPEIAAYLGHDLPEGASDADARAAVSAIGPAIELADLTFPSEDVEAILESNIYNRNVILGRADETRAGCRMDGLLGRIYRNSELVMTVEDPQQLNGDLVETVRYVANSLPKFGQKLRAGEFIITGTIVPPLSLSGSEHIRYELDPVDTVEVNIEDGKR